MSLTPDLTVSPDTITLRETQPITIPVAEVKHATQTQSWFTPPAPSCSLLLPSAQFEGEELVDQPRDTIDFLLAQADQFPEGLWG